MNSIQLQPIQVKRKAPAVAVAVKRLAEKLGPGQRMPTVKVLCDSLNVAIGTLDSALYDLEHQGVIERKNGRGIYVSPRIRCRNIGLVFGSNVFGAGSSPFYSMLLERCRQRAESHHERFSFYLDVPAATEVEGECLVHHDLADALEQKKLHGIIFPNRRSAEQERWLEEHGVPMVSMSFGELNGVTMDHAELVRLGVRSLAAQGCRRIGLISPLILRGTPVAPSLIQAHRETLAELGLTWSAEWIGDGERNASGPWISEAHGERALMKLLEKDHRALDGVVVDDDIATCGVLKAAKKLGLRVGTDLKVATHANKGSPVLREHEAVLTLVELDPGEVVEAMFEMLERLMSGTDRAVKSVTIKPKIRKTTTGDNQ